MSSLKKKARELDIHYKIKKSHLWAFDGERYQPVDDISELPDYQRRQQKSLQTVQNGTPFITKEPMLFRLIWTQQTMEMIYQ